MQNANYVCVPGPQARRVCVCKRYERILASYGGRHTAPHAEEVSIDLNWEYVCALCTAVCVYIVCIVLETHHTTASYSAHPIAPPLLLVSIMEQTEHDYDMCALSVWRWRGGGFGMGCVILLIERDAPKCHRSIYTVGPNR